jgi:hypothetical protein
MLSRRARVAAKESHSNAANLHPLTTRNASDTLKSFYRESFFAPYTTVDGNSIRENDEE